MQVEASTQHIQIPTSSIWGALILDWKALGWHPERMRSETDLIPAICCDIFGQHFYSSEMTQVWHSDGPRVKWATAQFFCENSGKCSDGESNFIGWSHLQPEGRGAVSSAGRSCPNPQRKVGWVLVACETVKGWDRHTHTSWMKWIFLFCRFHNVSTPIGRLSSLQVHCLKIPTNLEAQDFSRHKRRGATFSWQEIQERNQQGPAEWLYWLKWTGFCLNFEKHLHSKSLNRQYGGIPLGMWSQLGSFLWVQMPCASSLPGLRKTCSALLTEGLCHTSEERSFFFWTGKGTLVALQSRPKDFSKVSETSNL